MENKAFDLTNLTTKQEARAEDSSGLSCVLEEMENGTDLQPLEDLAPAPMVPFDDRSGTREDDGEDSAEPAKRQGLKRKILRVSVAALLLAAMVFGVYAALLRRDTLTAPAAAVYRKNGSLCAVTENGQQFTLENAVRAQLSETGEQLVYARDASSADGKYNLRLITCSKRGTVKNGGVRVADGAEENWRISADGEYVFYSVVQGGEKLEYAYIVAEKETCKLASGAQDVFFPPRGNLVYFTKKNGNNVQLYRVRVGEPAESIGAASAVRCFTDDTRCEIFYTVRSGEQYDLYKIEGGGQPVKIAAGISEVYLDDYTAGGNLYYFIKSDSKLNWNDFVDDPYADADAAMQKPDKGDFLVTKGFLLKRTVVDEDAYRQAVQKYERKCLRDEIRDALDQLDPGLAVSSEYMIRVYDGEKSRTLAGGVKLENLAGFSRTGVPQIVFRKTEIDAKKKLSMDTLYSQAQSGGAQSAADFVIKSLKGNFEISTGWKYARQNGSHVLELDFTPDYAPEKAEFLFLEKDAVFAVVKTDDTHDQIYYSAVGDSAVGAANILAADVLSYEISNGNLYYIVSAENARSLYACGIDGNPQKISDRCIRFFVQADGSVVLLTAAQTDSRFETADILLYAGGKTKVIDTGISVKSFSRSGERFAYIKPESDGGELKIFNGKKAKSVDTAVTGIEAFR